MHPKPKNYAFIDSQNMHLAIKSIGWKIDFKKFRVYLRDKYAIEKAFIFIGYIESNRDLYASLKNSGFICVFKPTLRHFNGHTKGNCDAELILHTMIEFPNYTKALIVSADGDFYCLIDYLIDKNKLEAILIPNYLHFSALLKSKKIRPFLRFMNDLKEKLEFKQEKTP